MKTLRKRLMAAALAAVLTLGVSAPAMAYTTPDFSDVPSNHWAYEAVMKMADAGVIKGTGNGQFSPEDKLTAEMFVVLVGRVVFPEVKAEGTDWSGPYVAEAKTQGLLTGTNVTDATLKAEISRYDMAVILRAAGKQLGVAEKAAQSGEVTDYGEIPTKYAEAVLTVYGMGLIRGDQTGSFNGANSMTRQEAATVMDRLLGLKGNGSQGGASEPETPVESQKPTEPDDDEKFAFARDYVPSPYDPDEVELKQGEEIHIYRDFMALNAWGKRSSVYLHVGDTLQLTLDTVPAGYGCTKDDAQWYSDNESIATIDENGLLTVVGEGTTFIGATIPVIYYGETMIPQRDNFQIFCVK